MEKKFECGQLYIYISVGVQKMRMTIIRKLTMKRGHFGVARFTKHQASIPKQSTEC